ncbi:hypothetical protein N9L06_01425 [Mariniblastus sp.]|nr:hypothetical protein [Mariniblastus sp.]
MKLIILTILIVLASASVRAEEPFIVFTNDKALQARGAKPYTLTQKHFWFDKVDGKYDYSKHSVNRTKKFFPRNADGLIVIDIEVWDLTPETRDDVYQKMLSVTNTVRTIAPGNRIGWYSFLPKQDYLDPIKHKPGDPAYETWTAENRANIKKFGHLFDFIAPSVFTFYESDTIESWSRYAGANIDEAVVANKQIYAFVWPIYQETKAPIPDELWRQQLRFLRDYKHCNGVFVFSTGSRHDWQAAVAEELLSSKRKAK